MVLLVVVDVERLAPSGGMMMMRRLVLIAALALSALAAPATASAAFEWHSVSNHSWYATINLCAMKSYPHPAIACWEHNGDWLNVGDLDADGQRAGAHWRTNYGRVGMCVNTHGVDANYPIANRSAGEHGCKIDMAEGSYVQFRAGRCNGSAVNCNVLGNWDQNAWSAWSPWYEI